jgi:hypothetical protein
VCNMVSFKHNVNIHVIAVTEGSASLPQFYIYKENITGRFYN